MQNKKTRIHEFYLIAPDTLKSLLSIKNHLEDKNKIIQILDNNRMNDLSKIHFIHNLLVTKAKNEEKKGEENQNNNAIDADNLPFNPSIHSSPIRADVSDNKISKEIKARILDSFVFPKLKENIFETSVPAIGNVINYEKEKEYGSDTEVDISKVRESFLRRINEAAGKDIDDVRDLSIAKVDDNKSFVNVRNRDSNSMYTVEKPAIFEEKKLKRKRKQVNLPTESMEDISPIRTRSGTHYRGSEGAKKARKKLPLEKSFVHSNIPEESSRRNSNFNTQWNRMAQYLLNEN